MSPSHPTQLFGSDSEGCAGDDFDAIRRVLEKNCDKRVSYCRSPSGTLKQDCIVLGATHTATSVEADNGSDELD